MRHFNLRWERALAREGLSSRGVRRVDTETGTHGFQATASAKHAKLTRYFGDAAYGEIGALLAAARCAIGLRASLGLAEEDASARGRRGARGLWKKRSKTRRR